MKRIDRARAITTMARMNLSLRISAAFVLLTLPACLSGTGRIAQIYDNLAHEVASKDAVTLPTLSTDKKHEERADEVREILEKGGELSAEDALKAAVILVGTDRTADLVLAEELAKRSAELGDKRGLRVMAEAIDKRLIVAELPQKYGTQFAFEFVLDSWRLYPIDPTTTDEMRASVMVPTYAELLDAEDALNQAHGKKPRR